MDINYTGNTAKQSKANLLHCSGQTIYDPIHNYISFNHLMWKIIDTTHFQRLRKLRQTSLSYLIFPGANHTRFEHSLGVGFLSKQLIESLFISNGTPIDQETKYYIDAITIAGLCHDIGHGPFSHLFDSIIKDIEPLSSWNHETFAENIINNMIETFHIHIPDDQMKLVKSLINGDFGTTRKHPKWIYQIVANQTNSIDVDKFDYILRDSYHTGLHSYGIDYKSIYNNARIVNDNICFDENNRNDLISLFQTRYKLHKIVYQHPKEHSINYMLRDALTLANDHFEFRRALIDVEHFLSLDDSIYETIKHFKNHPDEAIRNDSKLSKAAEIIRRIERKDIYKVVDMKLLPHTMNDFEPKINDLLSWDNPNNEIKEEDVILTVVSIDFGFKDKNPFNTISFYNNENSDSEMNKALLPSEFKERYVLFICKEEGKYESACKLYKRYIDQELKERDDHSQPLEITDMNDMYLGRKDH